MKVPALVKGPIEAELLPPIFTSLISDEHLPSLFERFYRVDKARSHRQKGPVQSSKPGNAAPAGTGPGLSIVQWIVQAHGGQIRVKSQIGVGSLFEVRLPLLNTAEE